MAQKSLKNFAYNNPIATGLGALALFFGGKLIYNKFFNKTNIPLVPPIPPIPPTPQKGQIVYSYSPQQYSDFAQQLFVAMDGGGTNEEMISKILSKMKTFGDVLALIDSYGKRKLGTGFGWDTSPMSLSESFYYEMDDNEIAASVNTPLKKTGYSF